MSDYLEELKHSVRDLVEDEFRDSEDIRESLKDVLRALDELDESITLEKDESIERIEARKILLEKINVLPIFGSLSDIEKGAIANLSIKYNKDIPSESELRENIYRKVMDLSNDSVIVMAYGRSTIKKLGENLDASKDEAFDRGMEALRRDCYLPQNIESTYAKAIDNIYANHEMFMAFLIEYFRG